MNTRNLKRNFENLGKILNNTEDQISLLSPLVDDILNGKVSQKDILKIVKNKINMHFSEYKDESNLRHVLGISGGKDSAALAIYIKDKYPDLSNKMEYFFTDTGAELKEIYDF